MNRLVATTAVVFGLLGSFAGLVRAEVTAEQVQDSIDRGVHYLLEQQRDDGSWPEMTGYRGGVSALCTLALVNAGVKTNNEPIQKALAYLRTIEPEKTYVVALQTMVLARAKPEKDRELIIRNVRWLESTQVVAGPNKGAWAYPDARGSNGDQSNSQFALLALHEAERVGVAAKEQTWRLAKAYWERGQNRDGSWGYMRSSMGTGSMTCAGIASLALATDRVHTSDARAVGDRIECCLSRPTRQADRIERAIRWLGHRFSVKYNPGEPKPWGLYYLYGLERAGRLTARRFIPLLSRPEPPNRADWYREGADHLVGSQDSLSGLWSSPRGGKHWTRWEEPLIGTSFALLFLSKGRWPVLMAKLQYGDGNDWNRHRSDVHNLTRYVESRWKRDLTWQVVDLRLAGVDDLIQTPVLYLCGGRSPLPKEPDERKRLADKLRDYLDRGGFLVAEAYCGGADFDKGFRELTREMFPEPEYKLRLLDPEHPIWHAEEKIDPRQLRPVLGIEFGCRTSVVYAPPDPPQEPRPSLSCLWELSRPGRDVKHTRAVQAQVDAALSLGINVLAYATNRELMTKESFFRRPTAALRAGDPVERGRIELARLRHPGGCNVAPQALVNLVDAARRELNLRAHVRPELLDVTDPALFDYHLVFMHGRTAFRLTNSERRQLRQYLERGGTLVADSICSSRAFSESFRREMSAVFPSHKLVKIPANDALLGTTYGGFDLRTVSRRDPDVTGNGGRLVATVRKVAPELEGIKLGDRWGVIFSKYDFSCALERRNSLECRGYTREDAARIGLNLILYSLH